MGRARSLAAAHSCAKNRYGGATAAARVGEMAVPSELYIEELELSKPQGGSWRCRTPKKDALFACLAAAESAWKMLGLKPLGEMGLKHDWLEKAFAITSDILTLSTSLPTTTSAIPSRYALAIIHYDQEHMCRQRER